MRGPFELAATEPGFCNMQGKPKHLIGDHTVRWDWDTINGVHTVHMFVDEKWCGEALDFLDSPHFSTLHKWCEQMITISKLRSHDS